MKYLFSTILFLFLTSMSVFGQNDNYIKIDALRLLYPSLGLTYETRDVKRGLEIELIYDGTPISFSGFPGAYNPMTMMFEGGTEVYKFDQSQMEIIFSYKRYFSLFKRDDRAYWGIFNRNSFLLDRDENYYAKVEEVLGHSRTKTKTFYEMTIGPKVGITIPLGQRFRFELGIGFGIDLLNTFGKHRGISYGAHLPILIGYKF